uniref:Uncharacterized protein n=1 Tax=Arundo donax TaxID=35708 RepID=A0A0A9B6G1_ARUDO
MNDSAILREKKGHSDQ